MVNRLFVLWLGMLWSGIAVAQYTDSTQHYISVASTGVINKADNSNSYVLANTVKFGVRKKGVSLNSFNNWMYGSNESGLTNNDFISTFDVSIDSRVPHLYYWGLANYTTSYSLKINNQFQTGAGIAYELIRASQAALNISEGILFEASDLYIDTVKDVYNTFRNSLRLRLRLNTTGNTVLLESTNFWQPSFSRSDDYIIRSTSNLTVKLRKWLGITAALTYNRFNRTKRENLLLNYGIAVEKYF